ncbi:hypothetical protein STANM309S_06216 [Streptomyces tanashiensis]
MPRELDQERVRDPPVVVEVELPDETADAVVPYPGQEAPVVGAGPHPPPEPGRGGEQGERRQGGAAAAQRAAGSVGRIAGSRGCESVHNLTKVTSARPPRTPRRLAALSAAPLAALASVLLAVGWLVLPAAVPARADDPVVLSRDGQITDRVGALGDRTRLVEDALDRLYDERRVQLFVVYVRDFSGLAQDRAGPTRPRSATRSAWTTCCSPSRPTTGGTATPSTWTPA